MSTRYVFVEKLEDTNLMFLVEKAFDLITKTCLYNFDALKPRFYIVKQGLHVQGNTLF